MNTPMPTTSQKRSDVLNRLQQVEKRHDEEAVTTGTDLLTEVHLAIEQLRDATSAARQASVELRSAVQEAREASAEFRRGLRELFASRPAKP